MLYYTIRHVMAFMSLSLSLPMPFHSISSFDRLSIETFFISCTVGEFSSHLPAVPHKFHSDLRNFSWLQFFFFCNLILFVSLFMGTPHETIFKLKMTRLISLFDSLDQKCTRNFLCF